MVRSHSHCGVSGAYKLADLWIDADGMPRQAVITEQNNDSTGILLSNIEKNTISNMEAFNLNYDKKKVKVIKG